MPPSFDFQDLWLKEEKGTPVVVKMENPNWDILELEGPPQSSAEIGKGKNKNAKQLTWVLLLKAHRVAGCVAYLAMGLWTLLAAIQNRLIAPKADVALDKPVKGTLYKFIRGFMVAAIVLLCIEVIAHLLGWQFAAPTGFNVWSLPHAVYMGWKVIRYKYIGSTLQFTADSCIVLFLIQSADRIIQFSGCVYVKLRKIKPIPVNPSLESDDAEQPGKGYPMVLIQIPMCNEQEVYEESISAVCQIEWPRNRMLVQVLDVSEDVEVQELIAAEVHKWHLRGVNYLQTWNAQWYEPNWWKFGEQKLDRCKELRILNLKFCTGIGDGDIQTVAAGSQQLCNIDLSFTEVLDQGLASLVSCNNVTDEGLNCLRSKCKTLQKLEVAKCSNVSSQGIIALTGSSVQLQLLNLSYCKLISSVLFSSLQRLKTLQVVRLDGCAIGEANWSLIGSGCKELKELSLSKSQGITDASVVGVVAACSACTSLQKLN